MLLRRVEESLAAARMLSRGVQEHLLRAERSLRTLQTATLPAVMATERLYFQDPFATTFEARVAAVEEGAVVLDRTLFYPEGGGQLPDRGELKAGDRALSVVDVQVDDAGVIRHRVEGALPAVGATVTGVIDAVRRRDHMSQHTGQHMLSRALADVAKAETVSSRLGSETSTIDVDVQLAEAAIARAEDLVNALVLEDRPVHALFPTPEELSKLPLRKQPKVSDGVRVIQVEGFDATPCGGTHCTRTGQVGPVHVIGVERHKGGTRLTFVAGRRALDDARAKETILKELAKSFTAGMAEVPAAVAKLRADLKVRTDAFATMRGELVGLLAASLHAQHAKDPNGTRIVVMREGDDQAGLRALASALVKRPDVIAFVGTRDRESGDLLVVVERGAEASFDAGAWFKRAAASTGGRGGGRAERAEGRLGASADLSSLARD